MRGLCLDQLCACGGGLFCVARHGEREGFQFASSQIAVGFGAAGGALRFGDAHVGVAAGMAGGLVGLRQGG